MINDHDSQSCCSPGGRHDKDQHSSDDSHDINISDFRKSKSSDETKREMIRIPGGQFQMGTDDLDGFPADGEGPVRNVELSPYYIDKYPVTNL